MVWKSGVLIGLGALVLLKSDSRAMGKPAPSVPAKASRPRVPRPPKGAQFRLRLLSFNMNGLPLAVGVDHSRYQAAGKILAERRRSNRAPQIVLLQEATHDRTQDIYSASGYPYFRRGPAGAGVKVNAGLMVMSEFPVLADTHVVYSRCVSWDCLMRKGVQYVEIGIPYEGGFRIPLQLFNTHMNSDPDKDFWTPTAATREVRFAQQQEMREFYSLHRQPEAVQIVGGDFNFRVDDPDYESFRGFTLLNDAFTDCGSSSGCVQNASVQTSPRDSIDHVFWDAVDWRVRVKEYAEVFHETVDGRRLSDHFGREYLLEITRR